MKKMIALALTGVMALSLAACGGKTDTAAQPTAEPTVEPTQSAEPAPTETTQIANPNRYDVGKEEMEKATGIPLDAPENAENVKYNIIGADTDRPMSEETFTLDGKEYCYRAQLTDLVELYKEPAADAAPDEILNLLTDDVLEAANISGIYTTWTSRGAASVSYCQAVTMADGEYNVICWLDVVPGILYNLSVKSNLNLDEQTAFYELADSIFVPAQGDA